MEIEPQHGHELNDFELHRLRGMPIFSGCATHLERLRQAVFAQGEGLAGFFGRQWDTLRLWWRSK